jgi:hypothetical protein
MSRGDSRFATSLVKSVLANAVHFYVKFQVSEYATSQELTKGWYPLRVRENEKLSTADGSGPESSVGYLSKFISGFLAVSIPLFALAVLFLHIPPARLTQQFLL